MIRLQADPRGTILPVRAQPKARADAVLGERGEALRVAVTAAPERGRANEAIAETLAAALGVKVARVSLLTGETSRTKRFLILGLTPDEVASLLMPSLVDATPPTLP